MITRKLGSLIRGKVTAFQVIAATTLGLTLGMMPSFGSAPGLSVLLIVLILLLNTNLFVVGLSVLLGKVLLLMLLPTTFELGRLMLDGPTRGLFAAMINAPVLALMGFEYYATTGGLILGVLLGLGLGLLLMFLIRSFRRKMAGVETGSERYQKLSANKPIKLLTWILFGKRGKKSYSELVEASGLGNPIRVLGAAAAVLLLLLGGLVLWITQATITTAVTQAALERVNRATVDLESAEVDLLGGRVTIRNLAMADANQLDEDIIRAELVEADLSVADLLRKRAVIENVQVSNAEHGAKRERPGRLIHPKPEPVEPPPPAEGEKTLEDYVRQAQEWKERLAQAREWIETARGPEEPEGEEEQTFDDWLDEQIALKGLGGVRAEHLIEGSPTVLVKQIKAEGVKVKQLPGETLSITATNFSTHPSLVEESPRVDVNSSAQTLLLDLTLPVAVAGRDETTLRLGLSRLPLDPIASQLVIGGDRPVQGGTYDIAIDGGGSISALNLPVQITLRDTTITIPGVPPQPVDRLPLTVGLRGPMSSPSLVIDQEQLADALVKAGADQLAARARSEIEAAAGKEIDKVREQLEDKVGKDVADQLQDKVGKDVTDQIGRGIGGFLNRDKDEDKEE